MREFAATAVHEFFSAEHGGHTLEVKTIYFLLEESAVHNLVGEIGVVERNDIEGLHNVGAVGAGERDVGGEMDRAAERLNAANDGFVGLVFALSVGVENGQQEGGELVSAGDAAKYDAGVCAVFEDFHFEATRGFVLFDGEVIRCGGEIGKEGLEFGRMRVGAVGVESECELRAEFGENLSNLLKESLIEHVRCWDKCKSGGAHLHDERPPHLQNENLLTCV